MFERIRHIRYVLVLVAVLIAIGSLLISNYLISDLEQEERNRMGVWAEAMRSLNAADENTDMNLVLKVINGNRTIPVILTDKKGVALSARNIGKRFSSDEDSVLYLSSLAKEFRSHGRVIRIDLPQEFDQGGYIHICYDESLMLKRLAIYPYIQLGVVVLFVLIAIFALFSAMRAEQNKVWVGLSKETAHQLGTPISSLIAWHEVLKENYPDDVLLPEMEKDIKRLERIAERFSKIGSIPAPKPENVLEVLSRVVAYMDKRTSNKVQMRTVFPDGEVIANLIPSLFEWVAENLCKNAVDALREAGIKAGLIRPITLWPFPSEAYIEHTKNAKAILTVEMSMGQMVEDVKLAVNGKIPVHFFGRTGGNIPYPNEVIDAVKKLIGGDK